MSPRILGFCFAALALALAAPALAIPPGYFVDSTQAAAFRPTSWHEEDGDFTLAITRDFPDSAAARLLGIAEATYPPRESLIAVAVKRGTEIGGDSAKVPLWWIDGLGATRVPYAVTAGALEHYRRFTERFRAHNFWEAFAHSLFWTELRYQASIRREEDLTVAGRHYPAVYIAQMSLFWSYDDGTFVPSSLANRTVILAPDGEVLSVEGDGETYERVTFSTHRGVGYVKTLMR